MREDKIRKKLLLGLCIVLVAAAILAIFPPINDLNIHPINDVLWRVSKLGHTKSGNINIYIAEFITHCVGYTVGVYTCIQLSKDKGNWSHYYKSRVKLNAGRFWFVYLFFMGLYVISPILSSEFTYFTKPEKVKMISRYEEVFMLFETKIGMIFWSGMTYIVLTAMIFAFAMEWLWRKDGCQKLI